MSTATTILRMLDALVVGTAALERIQLAREKVRQMIALGRDPTEQEWDDLFFDISMSSARLDAADKRLNEG